MRTGVLVILESLVNAISLFEPEEPSSAVFMAASIADATNFRSRLYNENIRTTAVL